MKEKELNLWGGLKNMGNRKGWICTDTGDLVGDCHAKKEEEHSKRREEQGHRQERVKGKGLGDR